MHGATLLGAGDAVLRPCMLWNDTRAAHEAALLDASPPWRETTGNIVFPGFTAPKLEWRAPSRGGRLRQSREGPAARRTTFACGSRARASPTCPTRRARPGWTSARATGPMRCWSDRGCRAIACPPSSRDRPPRAIFAAKSRGDGGFDPPRRWRVGRQCGSSGGGGRGRAGTAYISLGTSGVLFVATDGYHPAARTAVHTFCHDLPRRWHQMGVILAATDALNWLARLVRQDAAQLVRRPGAPASAGPLFLPHLGGESDADERRRGPGRVHRAESHARRRGDDTGRAGGRGVRLRECRDALARTGPRIERAVALGGGSRSAYCLVLLATVLGITINVPAAGELGGGLRSRRLDGVPLTVEGGGSGESPC